MLDVHRGDTIAAFLEKARDQLSGEFPALRSVAVENLIYVKEDLILPGHVGRPRGCASWRRRGGGAILLGRS